MVIPAAIRKAVQEAQAVVRRYVPAHVSLTRELLRERRGDARREEEVAMPDTRFPRGWDEERVRRVLAHYEEQSEEEAVAEN